MVFGDWSTDVQAGQNVLIQSGPGSDAGDALLATASHAAIPKKMNMGLIEMKDQERIDRQAVTCIPIHETNSRCLGRLLSTACMYTLLVA